MVGAPMAKVHLKAGDVDVDVQLRDPNKELNACWCAPLISICVPWLHCVALTHDLSGCRKFVHFVDVVPYNVEVRLLPLPTMAASNIAHVYGL